MTAKELLSACHSRFEREYIEYTHTHTPTERKQLLGAWTWTLGRETVAKACVSFDAPRGSSRKEMFHTASHADRTRCMVGGHRFTHPHAARATLLAWTMPACPMEDNTDAMPTAQ
jgi:hypothetical protein